MSWLNAQKGLQWDIYRSAQSDWRSEIAFRDTANQQYGTVFEWIRLNYLMKWIKSTNGIALYPTYCPIQRKCFFNSTKYILSRIITAGGDNCRTEFAKIINRFRKI